VRESRRLKLSGVNLKEPSAISAQLSATPEPPIAGR
jgi:hypothetical protein